MLSCVPDRAMTGTPIPPDPAAKYYWRIIGGCTGEDPVYSTNGTTVLGPSAAGEQQYRYSYEYEYELSWYEYRTSCVKIFLVHPSVRHIPKNLKRRSPFIFYVGWEVPHGVFFVINLVRFRNGVRPVS